MGIPPTLSRRTLPALPYSQRRSKFLLFSSCDSTRYLTRKATHILHHEQFYLGTSQSFPYLLYYGSPLHGPSYPSHVLSTLLLLRFLVLSTSFSVFDITTLVVFLRLFPFSGCVSQPCPYCLQCWCAANTLVFPRLLSSQLLPSSLPVFLFPYRTSPVYSKGAIMTRLEKLLF